MTEREIEAIAREYAYECLPPEDWWESSMKVYERVIDEITNEQILPIFKWLSDRYDIVSKEKIREAISNIIDAYNNGDNDMVEVYLEELESLFPQTLKQE